IAAAGADRTRRYAMDQSPAACLASAHATDDIPGGATHVGGVRDLSFGFLLRTGAGRGGENLLPTCVLCHVNRSNAPCPDGGLRQVTPFAQFLAVCRASNLEEAWRLSSRWQGASPAK